MKACLIFSPFSSLSHIPLGIAYLKSFIEKSIPSIRIKNLDLSNNFYHNLDKNEFSSFLPYLCLICPGSRKSKCKGILRKKEFTYWIKTASVSKSCIIDSKTNEFYNAYKYNKLRRTYDLFYDQIISCIFRVLKFTLEFPREENDIILEDNLFKDDINKILSEDPVIVGFSIFSASQLYYSLALAKILKTRINAQIIFGGAYIAYLDKKSILQIFDFIDFIIYKEGELSITSLLKNLKKRKINEIPNLVYRKGDEIIENKESVIHNLDRIPYPDFSDYNLSGYFTSKPVLPMLFSRGCFWDACTFCAHHKAYSNPYRTRSISNFIQEIKHYQKMGIHHIWFADEAITAADLELISKTLLRERIKIYYGLMNRPTGDFTYKILKRMYRAGCRIIAWGVESGSQRILNLMNKGTNAKEIKNLLKVSSKIGLFNAVFIILGFPTQTEEEILDDMKFFKKASRYSDYDIINSFRLEHDSAIFLNPKRFGLGYLKRNYLLKTKRGKLFSTEVSFVRKKKINWKRLNKLLEKKGIKKFPGVISGFCNIGSFCSPEPTLLHLGR